MRVQLISPPWRLKPQAPPLGLAYIGAFLREKDIEVKITDAYDFTEKQIENEIEKYNPDIVGVTYTTWQRFEGVKITKLAKEINPDVYTVVGGPHVSALGHQTLENYSTIDFVVQKEGEKTFLELVQMLENSNDLSSIKGLSYRQDDHILHNSGRPFITNLDELPFPYLDDFNLDSYAPYEDLVDERYKEFQNMKKAPAITSRGCPYSCTFCYSNMWDRTYRYMSPAKTVDLMEWMANEYGVEYIRFFDDNFTVNKKRTLGICKEIVKRKLDIAWRCESRVNHLNKEILKALKSAGCHYLELGVESGSEKVLKTIDKRITLNQAEKVFGLCGDIGIDTKMFIMIGLPKEGLTDIIRTANFVAKVKPDWVVTSPCQILPDSPLYHECLKEGRISGDIWLEEYVEVPFYTKKYPLMVLYGFGKMIRIIHKLSRKIGRLR